MLKTIKLSMYNTMFENGVGIDNYNRIGKLIRKHGTQVMVQLATDDHDQLEKELTRLETEY